MIVVGLGAGVFGVATGNLSLVPLAILYPIIGLLYIFPSLYLVRYSNRIREFVSEGQQTQLEAAIEAQRAFWRFVGILTVVGISLSVGLVIVGFIVGMFAARWR